MGCPICAMLLLLFWPLKEPEQCFNGITQQQQYNSCKKRHLLILFKVHLSETCVLASILNWLMNSGFQFSVYKWVAEWETSLINTFLVSELTSCYMWSSVYSGLVLYLTHVQLVTIVSFVECIWSVFKCNHFLHDLCI